MDQISNMLIIMKNGGSAGKSTVSFSHSKLKNAILECLKKEGYITSFENKTKDNKPVIEVELMYLDKKPKITQVDRISRQSKRVYMHMKDIHTVRNNFGLLVLSTPKGILSGKDARAQQVGGEALFKIW